MIAAFVILLGLVYLTVGIWGILVLHAPFTDLNLGLLITSILLCSFGVLSLLAGVGLWRKLAWARQAWLTLSVILIVFHLFWLVKNIPMGIGISDVIELGLLAALVTISWMKLRKKQQAH